MINLVANQSASIRPRSSLPKLGTRALLLLCLDSSFTAQVKHFSGLLCLESELASQSLRLVDGPSFEQKQELSTIPLFLLGKAHVRLGDDRQIGVIIGVGSCCLVLLIVIVYWATRRQGTPMRPE